MAVLFENFLAGTITDSPLAIGATTINSSNFANLPVVSGDTMEIVLDPDASAGAPEIVTVTAHTASATVVTVTRASQGTTAREHASGTVWRHVWTKTDAEEALRSSDNLSDVASAATARTNLGVAIGSDVQAWDADLDTIAAAGNGSVLAATTASFTTADETKLDGVEAGATADQTGAEIKAAYEAEADTNAFTDAEKTKLAGVETGADVTDTANVTAAGALMDSEVDADIKTLSLPANTTISTFGASLVDDASASAARTTLGLKSAATYSLARYEDKLSSTQRISGTTEADITGWSTTVSTSSGGFLIVSVSADASGVDAGWTALTLALSVNGAVQTEKIVVTEAALGSTGRQVISKTWIVAAPSSGSYTVKMRGNVSSLTGSGVDIQSTHSIMQILALGA